MPSLEAFDAAIHLAPATPFWSLTALGALVVAVLLYGAQRSLNRKRMMENTPTALIRSAAQGYTELRGMAELMDGEPICAPASLRRCVWFKYKVEQYQETGHGRDRHKAWVVVDQGTSDSLFQLTDTSASCAVDPDGAEVHASRHDVWYGQARVPGCYQPPGNNVLSRWFASLGKSYRYTEHLIRPGDALYIIGLFTTHGGAATAPLAGDGEVLDRLRALKRDQGALLREFDTNHDGKIDAGEWQAARARVERQVREENVENALPPAVDVIGRTGDRHRPFVISSGGEDAAILWHQRTAATLLALAIPLAAFLLWTCMLRLA